MNKNIGNFQKPEKDAKGSLLAISEDLKNLQNEIEVYASENEGEISDELIRRETELSLQSAEKIDNLVGFIKAIESKKEDYKKESKFFSDKAKTLDNLVSRIKEYVRFVHIFRKEKYLEGDKYKFRYQKNGGKIPLKIRKGYSEERKFETLSEKSYVINAKTGEKSLSIPERYVKKIEIEVLDKDLIREDLAEFQKTIDEKVKKGENAKDIYRDELHHNPELLQLRKFARLKQGQSVRIA